MSQATCPYKACAVAAAVLVLACGSESLPPTPQAQLSLKDGVSREDSIALGARAPTPTAAFSSGQICTIAFGFPGVVSGCSAPVPSVTPASPWLQHSGGIFEPEQIADISIAFSGPVQAITMASQGALKCSGSSLGRMIGYLEHVEVVNVSNALINPADCGADDVTFGVQGQIPASVAIDSLVIQGPSPWTFDVFGQPGRARLDYTITYDTSPKIKITCTGPVTRGVEITCSAEPMTPPATLAVTAWWFISGSDGQRVDRQVNPSSPTWSGKLVVGGTVNVDGTLDGTPASGTASVQVNARAWSTLTTLKSHSVIPTTLTSTPPNQASLGNAELSLPLDGNVSRWLENISDDGPNHAYDFLIDLPPMPTTVSQVNSNAINGTSPFYQIQEARKKKINGVWFCPKSVVTGVLFGLIEQHEGAVTNPDVFPNSHPSIFRRHVDSVAFNRYEPLAAFGGSLDVAPVTTALLNEAAANSAAMDSDSRNYVNNVSLGGCTNFHFGPYP